MHFASYLRSAEEIINQYGGAVPFASWLKDYFRQHKKFGSKDRRWVSDLCFCFFRLGHALPDASLEERLLAGQFLCHGDNALVAALKPEWTEASQSPPAEKLRLIGGDPSSLFPLFAELSNEIDAETFALSHLVQPDLFLRIRPGKGEIVAQKLQSAATPFSVTGDCVRLPNNTKIDGLLSVDEEVVVQDKSSQRVLDLFQLQMPNSKPRTLSAWDCCAASGGKSILLHDRFPNVQLTTTDIRESILYNLRTRFRRAGISVRRSFVADVSAPQFSLNQRFDLVLCDAPCSGSGTWGRTPEQLSFFKREKIAHYTALQKAIATNASKCVKQGGQFLYITCSVFRQENEDVVAHLQEQTDLRLEKWTYLKGYGDKADTLFAAMFSL